MALGALMWAGALASAQGQTLSVADAEAVEGGALAFEVTLEGLASGEVGVEYATSIETGDTAEASDFTSASGTLRFPVSETTTIVSVQSASDGQSDTDHETFTFTLSNPTGGATLERSTAEGFIIDPGGQRTMSYTTSGGTNPTIDEGTGTVTLTATLNEAPSSDVEMLATVSSTATGSPARHIGVAPAKLTFAAGSTSARAPIVITANSDGSYRPGTTTQYYARFKSTNQRIAADVAGAALMQVTDTDGNPTITLDHEGSGSEADGAVRFVARISPARPQRVTARWTASIRSGDSAETGDLTTRAGIVAIAANRSSATFRVNIEDDDVDEAPETFTVTISNPSEGTIGAGRASARGTIEDDDEAPVVNLTETEETTLEEHREITACAELEQASQRAASVDYATVVEGGQGAVPGVDFVEESATFRFAPGQTTKCDNVEILDDDLYEHGPDRFSIVLSNPVNARLGNSRTVVEIHEREAPPSIELTATQASAEEGEALTFGVETSGPSALTIIVSATPSFAATDTAAADDLRSTARQDIRIEPGERAASITVATVEDTRTEGDETFTLTLSNPRVEGGPSGARATLGAARKATGTIVDDEAESALSISDVRATEGQAAQFTVTLSPVREDAVSASWAAAVLAGDTAQAADLTGTLSGQISIAAGSASATITVDTVDDTEAEANETYTVTLASTAPGVTLRDATGQGTILDNDSLPVVNIVDEPFVAAEGQAAPIVATVRLDGAAITTRTRIPYRTTTKAGSDSATAGADFAPLSGTLVFEPGEYEKTLEIVTNDDTIFEGDETFYLEVYGFSTSTATAGNTEQAITITDDDGLDIGFTTSEFVASEGDGSVTIEVTADHAPERGFDVHLSLGGDPRAGRRAATSPHDFTPDSRFIRWQGGERTARTTVDIVDDTEDEGTEYIRLFLFTPSSTPHQVVVTRGDALVKLLDNDSTPTVTLEVDDDTVTENEAFTVKVKLSDASGRTASTRIRTTTASGDTATAGADYEPLRETLVFAPGETEKTLTIATRDDDVAERTQSLTVEIDAHQGLGAGALVSKKLFIEDEAADLAISFEVADETIVVKEDAGSVLVRTTLSRATEGMEYVLNHSFRAGTATSPGDYEAPSGIIPVLIRDGETEAIFTGVDIVNDDVLEEEERFTITVEAIVGADLPITLTPVTGRDTATVIIVDDEVRLGLEVEDDTVTEGEAFRITVSLNKPTDEAVRAQLRTRVDADDTIQAADYTALRESIVFAPGEAAKTFTVATTDDNLAELTQSVTVELYGYAPELHDEPTVKRKLYIEDQAEDLAITYEVEQDIRVNEDAGDVRVRTILSRGVEGMEYTLNYFIRSGTATSPGDYDAPSSQIPVPVSEGKTEVMSSIDIADDDVPEEEESFTIEVTANVDTELPITLNPVADRGGTTITIVDDDMIAEIADARATEGNDIEFVVTADAPGFIFPVSIAYQVLKGAGDTIEDGDVGTGRFTEQWTSGDRRVRTLVVPTTQDADEDNEQFTVRVARIGTATLRRNEAKGTVIDRANTAFPVLALTPDTIAEDEGATTVTATLSEAATEAVIVTVGPAPADARRLAGSGTISFAAGATTSTDSVVLTAIDNDRFQGNLTVEVHGTVSGSADVRDAEPAELVIEDDEEVPVVTIERVVEHKVNEGASTTLRITLSQASSDTIRVNHHLFTTEVERVLATEHVDFVPIDGQVVFAPGETEKRITLTTLDDDHFDPGEFVYIEISVPEGQRVSTGRRSTRVEINDDETTRIGFESTEVTVNETDGEVVLYVVFEEDAQWEGGGLRIFIVNKTPGTATSEDFDIEFQTGTWGLDARRVEVRIAIVDDGIAEGPETFTSELTPSNEATGVFALPGSKVVEITILDDDRRELRLDTRSLAGEEGTELGYTVRLGSQPSADVTITPTLTGSRTLGIHSDTQTLTFTSSNWHMPQTVRVLNPHDADDDDETATIVNAITGGDYETRNVAELAVEVSVRDDEGSGVRLDNPSRNATAAGVMVNEGETKTITVRTDRVSDGTDVVDLVNTGTASSADYVLEFEGRTVRAPHRIRVPEGRRDIRVTLRIVDDGRDDEPTETIVLGSMQNGRAGVQEVRLRISPCGAARPIAFALLSVDGEQNTGVSKLHSEPDDPVRSPFRLRICIVEPVTGMTIPVRNRDGSIGYSTIDGRRAAISIIAIEDTHPEEARADLSEGTFSNLRERVPGQIWTTTVTATRPGRMTIDMLPRLLPLVNSPQAQWPNNEGSQFSPYVRTNRRPVIPSGPLTAMFEDLPEEHGGRPFTFAARFSETLRGGIVGADHFKVTNAEIAHVRPAWHRWHVTVNPVAGQDASITLKAPASCEPARALCSRRGDKPLESAVTATVPAQETTPVPSGSLTASFENAPAEHNGWDPFSVEVVFSEPVALSAEELIARIETVMAKVTGAERVESDPGRWRLTVYPQMHLDSTLVLESHGSCGTPGAICTSGGQALRNRAQVTIIGPPQLRCEDALAEEGIDLSADFECNLTRAPSAAVSVGWSTRDVTAINGEDYTGGSGNIAFAAGATHATVQIPVLDDAIDEGEERFILDLEHTQRDLMVGGVAVIDRYAVGIIRNSDAMPKAWISRFGRTVGSQAIEAVSRRFGEDADADGVKIAGRALGETDPSLTELENTIGRNRRLEGEWRDEEPIPGLERERYATSAELLGATSFQWTSEGEPDAPRIGAWGLLALTEFQGIEDDIRVEGAVRSAFIGGGCARRALAGRRRRGNEQRDRRVRAPRRRGPRGRGRRREHPDGGLSVPRLQRGRRHLAVDDGGARRGRSDDQGPHPRRRHRDRDDRSASSHAARSRRSEGHTARARARRRDEPRASRRRDVAPDQLGRKGRNGSGRGDGEQAQAHRRRQARHHVRGGDAGVLGRDRRAPRRRRRRARARRRSGSRTRGPQRAGAHRGTGARSRRARGDRLRGMGRKRKPAHRARGRWARMGPRDRTPLGRRNERDGQALDAGEHGNNPRSAGSRRQDAAPERDRLRVRARARNARDLASAHWRRHRRERAIALPRRSDVANGQECRDRGRIHPRRRRRRTEEHDPRQRRNAVVSRAKRPMAVTGPGTAQERFDMILMRSNRPTRTCFTTWLAKLSRDRRQCGAQALVYQELHRAGSKSSRVVSIDSHEWRARWKGFRRGRPRRG